VSWPGKPSSLSGLTCVSTRLGAPCAAVGLAIHTLVEPFTPPWSVLAPSFFASV
jgi:hypothetical protein